MHVNTRVHLAVGVARFVWGMGATVRRFLEGLDGSDGDVDGRIYRTVGLCGNGSGEVRNIQPEQNICEYLRIRTFEIFWLARVVELPTRHRAT